MKGNNERLNKKILSLEVGVEPWALRTIVSSTNCSATQALLSHMDASSFAKIIISS